MNRTDKILESESISRVFIATPLLTGKKKCPKVKREEGGYFGWFSLHLQKGFGYCKDLIYIPRVNWDRLYCAAFL